MAGYQHSRPAAQFQLSLIGQRFGKITVVAETRSHRNRKAWVGRCDCGTEHVYETGTLTRANGVRSCGCSWKSAEASIRTTQAKTKHGHAKHRKVTKEYRAWSGMKRRCLNPSAPYFHAYGGRGISVCQRWLDSFEAFLEDMGTAGPGNSLERIDVNGNYEPGNCKWIPVEKQCLNTRRTRLVTAFGETKPVSEWCNDSRCVVGIDTLRARLRRGTDAEKAITTPAIAFADAGRMRHDGD